MFRQNKRRLAARRNNDLSFEDSNTSIKLENGITGFTSNGSLSLDEQKLYSNISKTKLNFYELPPQGEITLEEFETWAIDRLKILQEIQSSISRNKSVKEIATIIKPQLQKLLPSTLASFSNANDSFLEKKKDYYSHYILRLCFCRTKELRESFIRSETLLFKIRFNMLTAVDQTKFVQSLNLPLLQFISDEEKNQLSQQLYQTASPLLQFQLNLTDEQQRKAYFARERYIKLPFENVIELVGNRQVFINNGYAYLPQFQQLNLLASEFSNNISNSLIKTFQYMPRLNEDDRLLPILTHLSSGYTVTDFDQNNGQYGENSDNEINAESVWSPEIMKHYPLSVKHLMEGLKLNHHLRYNGRQQLSLFLKGIGLTADESLKFFAKAFTDGGHMTTEKFNKEYRYNFRHNYGLEGNRINYKPWDCRTILSKPRPGRGDYHGCPFRDFSSEKMTSELQKMNLTPAQIGSVLDSCNKGEYTTANTKVFEFTHDFNGNDPEINDQTLIAHPNLYFERSRQLEKKKIEIEEKIKGTVVN
ncbi:similar to Saccharomyces cerevisiae YKL045W PRI2 Subunit of DNA primase, which is required for DNA synthesis and double-strand break repair [Maudiozyma barnettii]|uniref:DNA primase large subunit n=1 Tax=Maudiozyma barnettii TaxID=61262 RepID=A0A8H2VJC0_9SACH|nr:DNA primase subunit PRI2 [Kazachstania barnettii]CAB4256420.1 similar to Saccharomyces cerevisiae YKL045W PRI2 Subunit of DNA primase, which is required for DNA synthesis and double-strand break repair [Kazachstania barnettii]CAD1785029.1 similar to Saccharomyces cerevisiae YKL045W PRI2 Subunit of DNA primase, which is required for DNA synthesis and double-strand break repair [Kazachstania barnettii]